MYMNIKLMSRQIKILGLRCMKEFIKITNNIAMDYYKQEINSTYRSRRQPLQGAGPRTAQPRLQQLRCFAS